MKGFVGKDKAHEVSEFFEAHPVPSADRVIKQCVEVIHTNTHWLDRDMKTIKNWLQLEQK